jgi:hypothetical protein
MREPEGGAEASFAEAKAAIDWAEGAGDDEVLAYAWYARSRAHLMRAQFAEQGRALEAAIEHARRSGDPELEIEIVTESAPPIVFGPVPVDEGFKWVDDILERLGDAGPTKLFAAHVLGHLWARRGEFERAKAGIDEWRTQFRELGHEANYASGAACLWDVCWLGRCGPRAETFRRQYSSPKKPRRSHHAAISSTSMPESCSTKRRFSVQPDALTTRAPPSSRRSPSTRRRATSSAWSGHARRCSYFFASFQSSPTPMSTASGGSSG